MRLHLEIATAARELPWSRVLAPGRTVAYDLLTATAPSLLATRESGRLRTVPFGYGPPVFPSARRRRGVYTAGGKGTLEFGSPMVRVVEAWSAALRGRDLLDWGGTALRILDLRLVEAPDFSSGRARMRTDTPVVLKAPRSDLSDRRGWVLPSEPGFQERLQRDLRQKAETLGYAPEIDLEAITWIGPRRSFSVGDGPKPGAAVEVELRGSPEALRVVWSWGLGQANAAGFGWVGSVG